MGPALWIQGVFKRWMVVDVGRREGEDHVGGANQYSNTLSGRLSRAKPATPRVWSNNREPQPRPNS